MTFSVIACTVAVEDAAKNHSNPAQIVCRKKSCPNLLGASSATGGHTVSKTICNCKNESFFISYWKKNGYAVNETNFSDNFSAKTNTLNT